MLNEAGEPSSLFNTTTFQEQGIEILYRHSGGVPWHDGSKSSMFFCFLKVLIARKDATLCKQSDEMHTKSCMFVFCCTSKVKKTAFSYKPSFCVRN